MSPTVTDKVLDLCSVSITSDKVVSTRFIKSLDELGRLEEQWRVLSEKEYGPIEQFAWVNTCARTDRKIEGLNIASIARSGKLVAVAPLAVKSVNGVRRSVMIGVDEHHEPMCLVANDKVALRMLIDSLANQRTPFLFERMPADSPALPLLKEVMGRRALVVTGSRSTYAFIELDDHWFVPESRLNSGRRSDFRRAQRKAEQLGKVTTEIVTPTEDQLEQLVERAISVEARSWKGPAGTAIASHRESSEFCHAYAREAARVGTLRICFLRIDGVAVAMQIAVINGNGFWLLKIGYDADYRQCSPGNLLMRETIAYAAKQGLKTFEFLGQSENWIEVWTSERRECCSVRVYPFNLQGAAALAADVWVKSRRAAKRKTKFVAQGCKLLLKKCLLPVLNRVARRYIAGPRLDDALRVRSRLAQRGLSCTIGYWDPLDATKSEVTSQYEAGMDNLAGGGKADYLSIKLPAIGYCSTTVEKLAQRATVVDCRLHFDAMDIGSVDRTWQSIDAALAIIGNVQLGCTLPGRWSRSVKDAQWVRSRELFVRVVKGEWADPADPDREKRAGYLEVIDALAGSQCTVAVATHDPVLLSEAIRRLQAAGTPCGVELLYGLPMRGPLRAAKALGVNASIYIPYGEAYLPYALSQLRRKPQVLWWIVRDSLASINIT